MSDHSPATEEQGTIRSAAALLVLADKEIQQQQTVSKEQKQRIEGWSRAHDHDQASIQRLEETERRWKIAHDNLCDENERLTGLLRHANCSNHGYKPESCSVCSLVRAALKRESG